uniref:Uncharacterized protein n=1 Tax=Candidozyma auris TaxID=498019 RepID=A0A0L0NXT1_CANAR
MKLVTVINDLEEDSQFTKLKRVAAAIAKETFMLCYCAMGG